MPKSKVNEKKKRGDGSVQLLARFAGLGSKDSEENTKDLFFAALNNVGFMRLLMWIIRDWFFRKLLNSRPEGFGKYPTFWQLIGLAVSKMFKHNLERGDNYKKMEVADILGRKRRVDAQIEEAVNNNRPIAGLVADSYNYGWMLVEKLGEMQPPEFE